MNENINLESLRTLEFVYKQPKQQKPRKKKETQTEIVDTTYIEPNNYYEENNELNEEDNE